MSRPAIPEAEKISNIGRIAMGTRFTNIQIEQAHTVLLRRYDAFQWDSQYIGHTNMTTHTVNMGTTPPIRCKQYPIPTAALKDLVDQQNEMEAAGLVEEGQNAKKVVNGVTKCRFCIDLRHVNDATVTMWRSIFFVIRCGPCVLAGNE